MNKSLRSGLVLLVLGIISGTLLALVNAWTDDYIAINEEAAQFDALKQFFFDPEDENYDSYNLSDLYDLSVVNVDQDDVQTIFIMKEIGTENIFGLGYLVSASGYSSDGKIQMLIVVDKDLNIIGYTVTSHKETSGFGADIVENDFNVIHIEDLTNFESVAGVTLTSNGVKECFTIVQERINSDLGGGLDE